MYIQIVFREETVSDEIEGVLNAGSGVLQSPVSPRKSRRPLLNLTLILPYFIIVELRTEFSLIELCYVDKPREIRFEPILNK